MDGVSSLGYYLIEDYVPLEPENNFSFQVLIEEILKKQAITTAEKGLLAYAIRITEGYFSSCLTDVFWKNVFPVLPDNGDPKGQSEYFLVIQKTQGDEVAANTWEICEARQDQVENLEKSVLFSSIEQHSASPEQAPALLSQSIAPAPLVPFYQNTPLKKIQTHFLKQVGRACYDDVFPCTVAWLTRCVVYLLRNDKTYTRALAEKIAVKAIPLLPGSSQPSQPAAKEKIEISPLEEKGFIENPELRALAVKRMSLANLQGIIAIFEDILNSPDFRAAFSFEFDRYIPESPNKELILFCIRLYGPEVAHAFLKGLHRSLEKPENEMILKIVSTSLQGSLYQNHIEKLRCLIPLVLRQALPEPIEAAAGVFFARLFDFAHTEPLLNQLEATLLAPFFPDPRYFPVKQGRLLVKAMQGFAEFLKTINDCKPPGELPEDQKIEQVINRLEQKANLIQNDGVSGSSPSDRIQSLIKKFAQQLIEDPLLKTRVDDILPLVTMIVITIFDYPTLDLLLERYIKEPFTFYNPYNADIQPALDSPPIDDTFIKGFSEALEGIKNEILNFCELNFAVKAALSFIIDLFSVSGTDMQLILHRLARSGSRLLPVMVVTKLSWMIPTLELPKENTKQAWDEYGRACIEKGLSKSRKKGIDFAALMNRSPEEWKIHHAATRKMILGNEAETAQLRARINAKVPYLARSNVLKSIQKLYSLGEHTSFWRSFVIIMLTHMTKEETSNDSSKQNPKPAT